MKKLMIIALALIVCGCSKKVDDNIAPTDISTKIVGTWTGTKNVTTYIDANGKSQVYDNKTVYTYHINNDGTASKTTVGLNGNINQVYVHSIPYKITSDNTGTFINFLVSPDDVSDKYQIITLTDHVLILNIKLGNVIPGTTLTGTNAVLDEEYIK